MLSKMAEFVPTSVLTPDELATLFNVERMLETVIDLMDAPPAVSKASRLRTGTVHELSPGESIECPVCKQVQTKEQLKGGKCFVCGTKIL